EYIWFFYSLFVWVIRHLFCRPAISFAEPSATGGEGVGWSPAKNFSTCPLMPGWATPSCSQPQ
ncbi:hypothetical protein, partial [Klebsiella quasipneumoniae]|uniref:hypothetical protein n=1 Tax=Klebsiella quasipneumoniae TaxID=1463165 RepID=UPI001CFD2CFD